MRVVAIILAIIAGAAILGFWWLSRPVSTTVDVYFVRDEGTVATVVPVQRTVQAAGTLDVLEAALRELLVGPTDEERASGLTTAIPPGTLLRSIGLDRGIVVVDFTETVESGGGSASMLGRFWQIVYTATQHPKVTRVRLLINGETRQSMGGEGVLIDRPIARPDTPPRF